MSVIMKQREFKMLKDRRVLMEQDLVKQKQACGALYLKIVMGDATPTERGIYEGLKSTLADTMTDLAIVDQMIKDGQV